MIVPYLRGYGTTRFLSADTLRNGQQAALAVDIIALMDALQHRQGDRSAGFDWGARTADIIAALWPERCKALVSVSGYLIGNQEAGQAPLPPAAELPGGTSSTSPPSAAAPATTKPPRLRPADLADCLAEMALRRRDLRPHRGGLRQPRPCRRS